MNIEETLKRAISLAAERVYATPVERDGVTVIPAARIVAGGGGGNRSAEEGQGDQGGGVGVIAKPVGALIVEPGGKVRWKGFIDVNRMVLGGQIVGIAFFLSVWLTQRSRARAEMKATIAAAAIKRKRRRRKKTPGAAKR